VRQGTSRACLVHVATGVALAVALPHSGSTVAIHDTRMGSWLSLLCVLRCEGGRAALAVHGRAPKSVDALTQGPFSDGCNSSLLDLAPAVLICLACSLIMDHATFERMCSVEQKTFHSSDGAGDACTVSVHATHQALCGYC
jgi:hypothetical protein